MIDEYMNCRTMKRSKTRVSTGVIDIGLKSNGWHGWGNFEIGRIEAFFYWVGTVDLMIDTLKSAVVRGSAKTWLPWRKNQAGTSSRPIAVGSR